MNRSNASRGPSMPDAASARQSSRREPSPIIGRSAFSARGGLPSSASSALTAWARSGALSISVPSRSKTKTRLFPVIVLPLSPNYLARIAGPRDGGYGIFPAIASGRRIQAGALKIGVIDGRNRRHSSRRGQGHADEVHAAEGDAPHRRPQHAGSRAGQSRHLE